MQAERRRQLGAAQGPRQLEDGERVAARLGHEPPEDAVVQPAGDDRGEQRAGVIVGHGPAELRQPGELADVGRVADGEHERHRFRQQPARDEAQHLRRGRIEPLRVVHEAQQRALRPRPASRLSVARRDQETVGSGAGCQAERHAERGLLRLRERAEPVEHRRAQLVQPRERQLHLRLDAGDPRDAEARRLSGRSDAAVPSCRHPPRPARQDRAAVIADVVQQPIERLALGGTAQQHRRTACGHGVSRT